MTKPPEVSARAHFHRTVSDMKASIDFYTRLLSFFYDHGVRDVAWLTTPGLLLTLAPGEPRVDPGNYFGFALASGDELEAKYKWLYERRQRLSAPPDVSQESGHFYVYDPDDYPVIFSWTHLDYPAQPA